MRWRAWVFGVAWLGVGCTSHQVPPAPEPEVERVVPSVRAALPLDEGSLRVVLDDERATIHLPGGRPRVEAPRGREPLKSAEDIRASGLSAFDIEAEPSMSVLEVGELMLRLGRSVQQPTYRVVVRGPEGIGLLDIDQRMGPSCLAEVGGPRCISVDVTVMPEWTVVEAKLVPAPTEADCKHPAFRAPMPGEARPKDPRPGAAWHGKTLLTPQQQCPTNDAELAAILASLERLGPRCPAASLHVHASLSWDRVAQALAVIRAEAALPMVMLNIDEDVNEYCVGGMVAEELSPAPTAPVQPPR